MVKLDDKVEIKGIGTMVTASFVKRNGEVCLYQRSDGPYEVFRVQVAPARNVFGSELPERETYPGNEDFGKTAWCYTQYEHAKKKFDRLCSG